MKFRPVVSREAPRFGTSCSATAFLNKTLCTIPNLHSAVMTMERSDPTSKRSVHTMKS